MSEKIEIVCIVCPNGCRLEVRETEGDLQVEGAVCKKGKEFAEAELKHPMRSLTSTVNTAFPDMPRLPVKTRDEIPKNRMLDAMRLIRAARVTERLKVGDVVIPAVFGTDIVATATM